MQQPFTFMDAALMDPFIPLAVLAALAISGWMVHELCAPSWRRARARRFLRREGLAAPRAVPPLRARRPAGDWADLDRAPLRRVRETHTRLVRAEGVTSSYADDAASTLIRVRVDRTNNQ